MSTKAIGTGTQEAGAAIARQAVVVVHGQGEQRPMGTIRDIVKVLWRFNPELGPLPEEEREEGRKVWIVPDDRSGLYELQRVTTPEHNGRRTDFFELYYADLLNDTPMRNLWRWMRRLLLIDPVDVPDRMRWPWTAFWLFTLVAIAALFVAVLSIPDLLRREWFALLASEAARIGVLIILGALFVLLAPKFVRPLGFLDKVPNFVIAGTMGLSLLWIVEWDISVGAVLFLIALIYAAENLLLPYFGDAASYLSAQTETVQSRQVVRNRGLKLLKALHDDPGYDRVVLIGHSLGSVLAYDLLHILWREVGPTKDNPPDTASVAALDALDRFVRETGDGGTPWTDAAIARYQALQWRAFDALRRQGARRATRLRGPTPSGWKISDFVALGSPLSSAQFLITENRRDFDRMKTERVLPTAPPQPYDEHSRTLYRDADGRRVAHHGAVFSVVRWTNIYDTFDSPFFLIGDPIAGPVGGRERFGNAVKDRDVTISHGPLKSRFFTHSLYWTETSEDWTNPSDHIIAFRDAVGLERRTEDNSTP